jgi:hypothetical protein
MPRLTSSTSKIGSSFDKEIKYTIDLSTRFTTLERRY